MSHLENDESVKIARARLSPSLIYESELLRRLEIGIGHGPIASPPVSFTFTILYSPNFLERNLIQKWVNRDARSDSENIAASNRKSERSTQAWILTRTSARFSAGEGKKDMEWRAEKKKKEGIY